MKHATGSYTGDGQPTKAITGLPLNPGVVIVRADGQLSVIKTSTMAGNLSCAMSSNATYTASIVSLDNGGFTVGNTAQVNTLNTVYYWEAWEDNGAGDMHIGSYTGTGSAANITGNNFDPTIMVLRSNSNSGSGNSRRAIWRTAGVSGDAAYLFGASSDATGYITALITDGFSVGTDVMVNNSGETYHFVCWKDVAGSIKQGTYTGNATNPHAITGAGLQPNDLFVKQAGAQFAVQKSAAYGSTTTAYFGATAMTTARITAFGSDGFTIESTNAEVNANTVVYRYAAWKYSAITYEDAIGTAAFLFAVNAAVRRTRRTLASSTCALGDFALLKRTRRTIGGPHMALTASGLLRGIRGIAAITGGLFSSAGLLHRTRQAIGASFALLTSTPLMRRIRRIAGASSAVLSSWATAATVIHAIIDATASATFRLVTQGALYKVLAKAFGVSLSASFSEGVMLADNASKAATVGGSITKTVELDN